MFDKERFIELIMNFVVFDKGIKKVCRYNQYFGIKRTQQRLNNLRPEHRDPNKPLGGILWHTQGSGKTLTMVLEYSSVKIVITDEIDELITHNIFYTAITRAQNKLKIYWTPEVEHKVLTSIKPRDIKKDVGILRKYLLQ